MRALVVIAVVSWLWVPVARADEAALRARVLAFAETRWGECSREVAEGGALATDIEIELVTLGPERGLALVRTACQQALDGAYNFISELVEIRGRRVAMVRVGGEEEGGLWNASLRRDGPAVELFTGARMRAIGDSGWEARHRWNGSRFVLVERRARDGGMHAPRDVGDYPIVSPPERACFAHLEVTTDRAARIVATHRLREDARDVALEDAECAAFSRDTLRCAGGVEYAIVARGDAWVVLRVTGEEDEREVARIPMGCSL